MKKELIYLASPYSYRSDDKNESLRVQQERYEAVLKVFAGLTNQRKCVYSPIVHCHPAAVKYGLPVDWAFWRDYLVAILPRCDKVIVLMLPGWEISVGVLEEAKLANSLGITVEYLES